jgi:hypothetical protein
MAVKSAMDSDTMRDRILRSKQTQQGIHPSSCAVYLVLLYIQDHLIIMTFDSCNIMCRATETSDHKHPLKLYLLALHSNTSRSLNVNFS